jgi:hypothetical protein
MEPAIAFSSDIFQKLQIEFDESSVKAAAPISQVFERCKYLLSTNSSHFLRLPTGQERKEEQ